MALDKFNAPSLPNPGATYDVTYMRQLIRAIELYFSQLDSNTPNYAQQYTADRFIGSGVYLTTPYNQFKSYVDQTAAAVDEAYALELEVTDFTDGVEITGVNNTRITFSTPGVYYIISNMQFENTDNLPHSIDIWFRADGSDISDSNTRYFIPARKSIGAPAYLVPVTPYMVTVATAGSYIEIMWRVESTLVSLQHLPAVTASPGVTPAIPATSSAMVQVFFMAAV